MNDALKKYAQLTEFLSGTLGNAFEAALFDLSDPGLTAVSASNFPAEHQDAVRALIREALCSRRVCARGMCLNRQVMAEFGNLLKVSLLFIKDGAGEMVGALCLTVRCGAFLKLMSLSSDMLSFNVDELDDEPVEGIETDAAPHEELSLEVIDRAVEDMGIEPGRASPDERIEVITDLNDMGVFELKGAVARCAELMGISVQSVYRYLSKIKRARG